MVRNWIAMITVVAFVNAAAPAQQSAVSSPRLCPTATHPVILSIANTRKAPNEAVTIAGCTTEVAKSS